MELRARFPLLDRALNGVNVYNSLCRRLIHVSYGYPRLYLTFTIMVAGIGYGFIFMFPYLLLSTSMAIYATLESEQTAHNWLIVSSHICSLFMSGVFTHTLSTMRFTPPPGRLLAEREAPLLFRLLAQLRQAYGNPPIHRIMLDGGDDVRVIKTPRSGFPILCTTTLVVGLPLLHTVSPRHLRVLLARRIGQLSGRYNLVTGALFHLKGIWQQYRDQRHSQSLPSRLVGHFFSLYAPIYNTAALGIIRTEELNADRYALDVINGQEIAEAISFHAAGRDFLSSRYWPTIMRMTARTRGKPDYLPYEHLTTVARKALTTAALATATRRLFLENDFRGDNPPLGNRLDNLGYSGPVPLQELKVAAAPLFLESSLPAIVKTFHDHWINRQAVYGTQPSRDGAAKYYKTRAAAIPSLSERRERAKGRPPPLAAIRRRG